MLLSTEAPSQLVPVNLVTRPSLSLRPVINDRFGPNEVPDDDDAIVIEAEITESTYVTTSSTSGKREIFSQHSCILKRIFFRDVYEMRRLKIDGSKCSRSPSVIP